LGNLPKIVAILPRFFVTRIVVDNKNGVLKILQHVSIKFPQSCFKNFNKSSIDYLL